MKKIFLFAVIINISFLIFSQNIPTKDLKLAFENCSLSLHTVNNNYSASIEKNGNFINVTMTLQDFSCTKGNEKIKAVFKVSSSLFNGEKTFNYLYEIQNGQVKKVFEPINQFAKLVELLQNDGSLYEKNGNLLTLGTNSMFTFFFKESMTDRKQLLIMEFISLFNIPSQFIDASLTINPPCEPLTSTNASAKVFCGNKSYVVSVIGGECWGMNDVGAVCSSSCGSASVQCNSLGLDASHSSGCGRID